MAAPAAPKNARWERTGPRDCVIRWDPVVGATSYGVRWLRGTQTDFGNSKQGWTRITGTSLTTKDWAVNTGQRFVVYATNKDGNSAYSNVTGWFYTPPVAPKNVKAVATAEGMLLSWSRAGSYYTSGTQIEGAHGAVLGNGVRGAAPTTHLFPDAGGIGLTYRVRGFVGGTGEGQRVYGPWSPWTTPITRLVAPAPPLLGAVPNVGAGSPVVFSWVPATMDGTAQMGAELRYRPVGGAWVTRTITDNANTYSQTGLGVGQYEWQARTKALSGDWGEWSEIAVFRVVSKPVLTLAAPATNSSRLTVTWTFTQAEGLPQSEAIVELLQNGGVIETLYVNGSAKTAVLRTVLLDETTYTVRVIAAAGGAWTATATRTFTTSFLKPAAPLLVVTWDEDAGFHLVRVAAGPGGETPTLSIDLYADIGGGWVLFAEDLPATESLLPHDWGLTGTTPTLYRAVAYGAHGAATVTIVSIAAESDSVWVKSTEGRFAVRYDVGFEYTPEKPNRELVHFDGETKPVVFDDDAVTRRISVTGHAVVADSTGDGDLQELRASIDRVLTQSAVVMVCTPDGLVLEGVVTSATVGSETGGVGSVSFEVEEAM